MCNWYLCHVKRYINTQIPSCGFIYLMHMRTQCSRVSSPVLCKLYAVDKQYRCTKYAHAFACIEHIRAPVQSCGGVFVRESQLRLLFILMQTNTWPYVMLWSTFVWACVFCERAAPLLYRSPVHHPNTPCLLACAPPYNRTYTRTPVYSEYVHSLSSEFHFEPWPKCAHNILTNSTRVCQSRFRDSNKTRLSLEL